MSENHKRLAVIAAIVLSLVPAPMLLTFPGIPTLRSVALYASAVIGYWGIVLMLWMYMLGTKAVTALVFSDLAPVLRIHKALGKYATPMIFLHPLLIAISYGANLLTYSVIPRLATRTDRHILLGQIALWLLALTWITSALIRRKMAFRPWKYLHYLAYICIPFVLLHVPDLGSQETTHVIVKGYLFLLGVVFLGFTGLRLRSLLNLDTVSYRVLSQTGLTPEDYMLRLIPISNQRLAPHHGQYVYIKLGIISEDHPFSVVHFNPKSGELVLAYRLSGMYTKELQKLTPGATVYLSGPFGSFTADLAKTDTQPVVYIAGGIGITPFVAPLLDETATREQWLFVANRSRATAVLVPELSARLGPRCVRIYNQETDQLGSGEHSGYIHAGLLTSYLSNPSNYQYYICGPPSMMAAIKQELASLSVPAHHVHSEEFGW